MSLTSEEDSGWTVRGGIRRPDAKFHDDGGWHDRCSLTAREV